MSLNATSPGCFGTTAMISSTYEMGIPPNITAYYRPNTNKTLTTMTRCCSPSPVNIGMEGCFLWCEVAGTRGKSSEEAEALAKAVSSCGKPGDYDTYASGTHIAEESAGKVTMSGAMVLMGLMASLAISINGLF